MNDDQFKAAKATMPWTEHVFQTGRGNIIQVIDNRGQEVPLFTMTAFLALITRKLSTPAQETQNAAG